MNLDINRLRVKREDDEELEKQLCADKSAGEWFRLETGDDKCRDVIQCTVSVTMNNYFMTKILKFTKKMRFWFINPSGKLLSGTFLLEIFELDSVNVEM